MRGWDEQSWLYADAYPLNFAQAVGAYRCPPRVRSPAPSPHSIRYLYRALRYLSRLNRAAFYLKPSPCDTLVNDAYKTRSICDTEG